MVRKLYVLALVVLLLAACGAESKIQDNPELQLSKNMGYSNFGDSEIQGSFILAYSGPKDVVRVAFLIDDQPLGPEDDAFPFKLNFDTGSYSEGTHTLSAIGYTADGRQLASNQITTRFVSAAQSTTSTVRLVVPILVLVVVVTLLGIAFPLIRRRGKPLDIPPGTPRKYGLKGGAICPRCGRPFSLNLLSLNLVGAKLDRCPFCGKWAMVRPRSMSDLRAAEAAEIQNAQGPAPELSAEEKLRKDLENSRYQS